MAKVVITIEDKPPVMDEHGEEQAPEGLGVDVECEFEPDAPAIDGRPDMENCTSAQGLAFVMLTIAQEHAQEAKVTRIEGAGENGERKVILPDD